MSAPAGFGKSTLVADWLAETGQPAAWLSLDEGDNDPARFWTYLIAAVQTVYPDVGHEAHEIAAAPQLLAEQTAEWVVEQEAMPEYVQFRPSVQGQSQLNRPAAKITLAARTILQETPKKCPICGCGTGDLL